MIWDKVKKYLYAAPLVSSLIIGGLLASRITSCNYEKKLASMRNEVASQAKTIELQKGVYEKLTLETTAVQDLLEGKGKEIERLKAELKKSGHDVLAANQLILKWKKAYEGAAGAHQEPIPPVDGKPERTRVTFSKDFGSLAVNGWTLTNPAEAWVKVDQLKPLELTLIVSQDSSKRWHALVTSSDENTSVEIKLSAVNPHVLEPKWYQRVRFHGTAAFGSTGTSAGVLLGLGASYEFGRIEVGPSVFLGISDRVDKYFGAQFAWRPF